MKIPTRCWLLVCGLQPLLTAQDLEIQTVDGRRFDAGVLGLEGEGEEARLQLAPGGEMETLALASVLALHGEAPSTVGEATVGLVGGDQLRGRVRGGDAGGETFVVESSSLGRVAVQVDRLREMVLGPGIRAEDLVIPESAEADEALFFPTGGARLDLVTGALHRFTDRGVVFAEVGEEPREVAYGDLAGVALRGGFGRDEPAQAALVTRTGDSLGVDLVAIAEGRFRFALEGGEREVELPQGEISALTFLGESRRFLSDLDPDAVEEASYFEDELEPLYPFRRDRSVTGAFLVAGGRTHAKGLGVHSRSRLSFRVPAGFSRFTSLVAVDDEVKSLGLRADVNLRVLLGEHPLFQAEGVRSGDPVRSLGVLDVTPGEILTLEVEFGRGFGLADRVDWLTAVFLK